MYPFPTGGILGKLRLLWGKIRQMEIPSHAANAGYFIVLSVFPALVLILSLLRYTALDAGDFLELLSGFLPEALLPSAQKLIVSMYAHTSTAMVSLSAVGALWSSSRGVYGLLTGLNTIYGVGENRGYVYTRVVSMGYTVAFLAVLVVTLVFGVFGEQLMEYLPPAKGALGIFMAEVVDFRFLLMLLLQTALFTAMYTVLPNRKNKVSESFPGAVLASLGWLIFTRLFSYYVEHYSRYSSIYGSVYALALSMLWLYCCLSIVFYGGALNALLLQENER